MKSQVDATPQHKARTIAFYCLTFLSGAAFLFILFLHDYAAQHGLYTNNLSQAKAVSYRSVSYDYANYYANYAEGSFDNSYIIPDYVKGTVTDSDGTVLWSNQSESDSSIAYSFIYSQYVAHNEDLESTLDVALTLAPSFVQYQPYSTINTAYYNVYRLKDKLLYMGFGLSALFIFCLVGLIQDIRRKGTRHYHRFLNMCRTIPFDGLCLLLLGGGVLMALPIASLTHDTVLRYAMVPQLLSSLLLSFLFLMFVDGLTYRLVTKTLLPPLLIRRGFNGIKRGLKQFIMALPSIYLLIIFITSVILIDVIVYTFVLLNEPENIFIIFGISVVTILFLLGTICYMYYQFMHYEKATESLASGRWNYTVPTQFAFGHFHTIATQLNQASDGMQHAIERQLKSERMKTELITNVSHDLKTPLTSIINYSDLITRELDLTESSPSTNTLETTKEFATTLHHESRKLLTLINNLIEASRASSGNLDCLLESSDTSVILEQLEGEYEQALCERELEFIIESPTELPPIQADSRHIWRVFDNLMTNIVKYSLPNTRVYLELVHDEHTLSFIFKNVSKDRISLSSDELIERFVQSDTSRHSDGHGLGLSIVQSLMTLQKGTLALDVSGDLFTATVSFPLAKDAVVESIDVSFV